MGWARLVRSREFPVGDRAPSIVSCTDFLCRELVSIWIPPQDPGNLSESSCQCQPFIEPSEGSCMGPGFTGVQGPLSGDVPGC